MKCIFILLLCWCITNFNNNGFITNIPVVNNVQKIFVFEKLIINYVATKIVQIFRWLGSTIAQCKVNCLSEKWASSKFSLIVKFSEKSNSMWRPLKDSRKCERWARYILAPASNNLAKNTKFFFFANSGLLCVCLFIIFLGNFFLSFHTLKYDTSFGLLHSGNLSNLLSTKTKLTFHGFSISVQ